MLVVVINGILMAWLASDFTLGKAADESQGKDGDWSERKAGCMPLNKLQRLVVPCAVD